MTTKEESLADELAKPLEKSNKRKVTDSDLESSDEEEKELLSGDITDETKAKIFSLLKELTGEEIKNNEHLITVIEKVNKYSEAQGQAYYETLQACLNFNRNGVLAKRIVLMSGDLLTHPTDPETTKEMVDDNYLVACVTTFLGKVFARLGNFGGIALFATYIISSHYKYGEKSKSKFRKTTITPSPISNDGQRPQPNGENNLNGEIIEKKVGQSI